MEILQTSVNPASCQQSATTPILAGRGFCTQAQASASTQASQGSPQVNTSGSWFPCNRRKTGTGQGVIDLVDPGALHSAPYTAHPPRHLLARPHLTRVLAGANASCRPAV